VFGGINNTALTSEVQEFSWAGTDEEEILRYAANVFGLFKPWGVALITAFTPTIRLCDDKHALYCLGWLRLSGNQFTQSAMRAMGNRERDRVESNLP
jgi:hypothetical protein